jgi:type III pantothenate kinase
MTTVLALDLGNSRLKWGLLTANRPPIFGSVANDALTTLPLRDWKNLPTPQVIIGANVATEGTRVRLESVLSHWRIPHEWIVPTRECCGVVNRYEHPETLGADRWANLIALRRKQLNLPPLACGQPPVLHVSLGTAVVIDALDADGNFLGGTIMPSVSVMRQGLAMSTAALTLKLPVGELRDYPTNTSDAIFTGCVEAIAGLIDRWRDKLAAQHRIAPDDVALYIGGGEAQKLANFLPQPHEIVENLALLGLFEMALSRFSRSDSLEQMN